MTLAGFVDTLLLAPTNETGFLLAVCAEILGDADLQARMESEVKPRMEVVPPLLVGLPRFRVKKAVAFGIVLGGEETIALEVKSSRRLHPDGCHRETGCPLR